MYVIQIKGAGYVTGFNGQFMIVQVTAKRSAGRKFKTAAQAAAWVRKYADAGFGMNSDRTKVVAAE